VTPRAGSPRAVAATSTRTSFWGEGRQTHLLTPPAQSIPTQPTLTRESRDSMQFTSRDSSSNGSLYNSPPSPTSSSRPSLVLPDRSQTANPSLDSPTRGGGGGWGWGHASEADMQALAEEAEEAEAAAEPLPGRPFAHNCASMKLCQHEQSFLHCAKCHFPTHALTQSLTFKCVLLFRARHGPSADYAPTPLPPCAAARLTGCTGTSSHCLRRSHSTEPPIWRWYAHWLQPPAPRRMSDSMSETSCAIRGARGGDIGHRSPPGSKGKLRPAGCGPGVQLVPARFGDR
jgi:hypothetical protein